MILSHRTIRPISVNHPLGKDPSIPFKIEPERLLELVKKLRSGDESVIEEIVRGHIRLAIHIACRYTRLAPNKGEVLISEAFYGIMHAINNVSKMVDDNITPWITSNIHRFVYKFLSTDFLVPVPISTIRLKKLQKTPLFIRSVEDIAQHEPSITVSMIVEVKELIMKAVVTENEKIFVEMRIDGFQDTEIAARLNVTESCIANYRNNIRERYERLK